MSLVEIAYDLIEGEVCHADGSTEYILKNHLPSGEPTKLGHAFEFLPPGILHKEETGIGATTLELQSKRNSIIVEPFRSTALNKSKLSPDYFFVGTKTDGNTVTEVEIKSYVEYQEQNHKCIKIICVADSLSKVIYAIGKEKIETDNYHLLIDESDILQTASMYRKSMELVLDQYKSVFKTERRSMVTATPLTFTDPLLKDEPIIKFRYKKPTEQQLYLIKTDDVSSKVMQLIKNHLKEFPHQKLAIAYNNVREIRKLADNLVENEILNKKDIKVLCSRNSQKKVTGYFHELTNNELPAKLVFKTSAYFVGYDLDEPYHLIIATNAGSKPMQLSELTIKQIAGRARNGLLSLTVVTSGTVLQSKERLDFNKLLDTAKTKLEGYKCLIRNFEKSEHLLEGLLELKERVEKAIAFKGFQFVRHTIEGNPEISYLNIDGYIEQTRVMHEIYGVKDGLEKALTNIGFKLDSYSESAKGKLTQSKSTLEEMQLIKKMIDRDLPGSSGSFDKSLLEKTDLFESQLLAYQIYYRYENNIDPDFLREQILLSISDADETGTKRSLNKFEQQLYYHLLNPLDPFKKYILAHVELKKRYSKENLLLVVNNALALTAGYVILDDFKEVKKILNCFFEIRSDNRTRKNPKGEIKNQKIVSFKTTVDSSDKTIFFPEPIHYLSLDVARFRSFKK